MRDILYPLFINFAKKDSRRVFAIFSAKIFEQITRLVQLVGTLSYT